MRRSGRSFAHSPKRCEQGSVTPNGCPVYPATCLPHHSPPLRSACPRPPAYYKHQKLLATPGQRTRVNKKSSGVIFQGPMHGSSCILNHTYRSQCLRSASMKQPTMYSYMASHRHLLPNRVHTLSSHTVGHVHTPLIHPR